MKEAKALGKRKLTANDREALMRLNVAQEILIKAPEWLAERVKLIPNGKRDLAMMAARIRGLMQAFTATIPDEQLMTYYRNIKSACYAVGVRNPGTKLTRDEKNYGMWIPFEVLNELLEARRDRCMMCDLDKARRRACPLKKALDTLPNDVAEHPDGDCPYFEIM